MIRKKWMFVQPMLAGQQQSSAEVAVTLLTVCLVMYLQMMHEHIITSS